MTSAISTKLLTNTRTVLASAENYVVYALLEVRSGLDFSAGRFPINLALALDCSSSMYEERSRILAVGEAIRHLSTTLAPDDNVAAVVFAGASRVILGFDDFRNQRQVEGAMGEILNDALKLSGGTNIASGLRKATTLVAANAKPTRANKIVLVTDGQSNTEEDESESL